jgi:cytochrome oxidase assembly protein ShyY1
VRFLLSRRWVLFALFVGVLAFLFVRLGEWQFHRQDEREQRNAWTERNLEASPAPVEDVMAADARVPEDREWLRVRASGTYDAAATVIVRYQTRDGDAGVDLVTPLVTSSGTALLVDRGWIPTDNTGDIPTDLPAPPPGEVEVVGFVRADSSGGGTEVRDGSTRAISSEEIGATLDYPVYDGFVDAETEDPAPAEEVVRAELPDLGEGPHFFYGIQWWFFGALAVLGFAYLVWDEKRGKNRRAAERAGVAVGAGREPPGS